jgi:hypothetical protein
MQSRVAMKKAPGFFLNNTPLFLKNRDLFKSVNTNQGRFQRINLARFSVSSSREIVLRLEMEKITQVDQIQ